MRTRLSFRSVAALLLLAGLAVGFPASGRAAPPASIPPTELARAPSRARVAALVAEATADPRAWAEWSALLRPAALTAHERRLGSAQAWLFLCRWCDWLGQPESAAMQAWIKAMTDSKLAHGNLSKRYEVRDSVLGARASRELLLWALASPNFSERFFQTLKPTDHPVEVLKILTSLQAAAPAKLETYASLAVAIAVVYDTPPPPGWPHGQVSATALPRRLPPPVDAFLHWIKLNEEGRSRQPLDRLPAAELTFVVDTPAPFSELEWARDHVRHPLPAFAAAYSDIRYRRDRMNERRFHWERADYTLASILEEGGICVDQAYFAAQAGKAWGVPTLLFRGAGLDGRHAWFGFLDGDGRWQLDAGRGGEQRFVAGFAHDPQTWGDISDHELLFLAGRFRQQPAYRQSQSQANFAVEYLRAGRVREAVGAARQAVNLERRNVAAWNLLLEVTRQRERNPREHERVAREAIAALEEFPDLQLGFVRLLAASLRGRGETSAADAEEARVTARLKTDRSDLALVQAREAMERAIKSEPIAAQSALFVRLLEELGPVAGIDFFDRIATPFVRHLRSQGEAARATELLERVRRVLAPAEGSMLDRELRRLAEPGVETAGHRAR